MKTTTSALALVLTMAAAGCATTQGGASPSLYGDYLSGRYADLQRDSGVATERYFSALRQDPKNTTFLDGAVESALTSGDIVRGEAAARMAVRGGMESDLGRLTLASLALHAGRFAEADSLTGKAQGGAFDRLASRVVDAWALAGQKKKDDAVNVMAQVGGGPLFKPMYDYQRAMIYDLAGDTTPALTAFELGEASGIRLAPGLIRHGRLLERTNQRDRALALYRAYLAKGDDPTVRAELARLEGGGPDTSGPITPSQGAATGLFALSSTLIGQADPDFYLPYLTLTQILDPDLHVAALLHGEGLRQIKQYVPARTVLGKIPPGSPWYATARTRIAWIYNEEGKPDQALATARDLAAQDNSRLARMTLADLERATEHFTEAEALYGALIAEHAKPEAADWALYYARGACRDQIGRSAEGEADLKKALDLSPDQPEVLNYLGYSWVDRGVNLQEGLAMLRKAVMLQPQSGYILDSLSWAYYKLGEYDAALEGMEHAVELDPEDATLNDHLGDIYWRLGRKVEARFQWSRALALKPEDKAKAQIEAKLKQGLPELVAPGAAHPQTVRNSPR